MAVLLLLLCVLVSPGVALADVSSWTVQRVPQAPVPLEPGSSGAGELSGVAWIGNDSFLAVSDRTPVLFPLTIRVDPASGRILSASIGRGLPLAGSDLEGIDFLPPDRVVVSDERGPHLRVHSAADGRLLQTLPLPPLLTTIRSNLGLEAVTWDEAGRFLWTANEEALRGDGPVAGFETGSLVRLFRFDAAFAPAGQWAYRTDPLGPDIAAPGRDLEASGVVALLALSDGSLLVLERAVDRLSLRHRLYRVDVRGAADVTKVPRLADATVDPVPKSLLWEGSFVSTNFEGMTLGPRLGDGRRSLILVSDDGSGLLSSLLALTLQAPPTEAGPGGRDHRQRDPDRSRFGEAPTSKPRLAPPAPVGGKAE